MKITVEFDSEEEFKARIKNPRGKAGEKDDAGTDTGAGPVALPSGGAPAPIMPQPQGYPPQTSGFVQAQPNFAPQGQAYPPQQQPQGFQGGSPAAVDPVVAGLVQRISAKLDVTVQSGQGVEEALKWFRGQCGPEATNATLDQIKQTFLFKLPAVQLNQIATMMAA